MPGHRAVVPDVAFFWGEFVGLKDTLGDVVDNFTEVGAKMIEATEEIFSSMIMMEIKAKDERINELGSLSDSITGVVGLAGTYKGLIAIHLPVKLALAITSSFLGMEVEELNEDVHDAIGEVANMLGGSIKTALSEKGNDVQLSLPSTISGEEYMMQSGDKNVERIIIPFAVAEGNFHVELELEV